MKAYVEIVKLGSRKSQNRLISILTTYDAVTEEMLFYL